MKVYSISMEKVIEQITNVNANKKYFSFIPKTILSMQRLGVSYDVKIPGSNVNLERVTTPSKLAMLRRQFINFSKMQQNEINQIATLFIQYLNNNIR